MILKLKKMEILTYATNVRNNRMLEKLSPLLDQVVGSANWGIDLDSREHKLSVYAPGTLNEYALEQAFRMAGVSALNLDDYYSIY